MKTQAWGWLIAGVLAAGLNASYHDGGLHWAHEAASQLQHGSAAVVALATGRTDQFLTEARFVVARNESASCRLSATLEKMRAGIERSQARMSDQEAEDQTDQLRTDEAQASEDRADEARVDEAQMEAARTVQDQWTESRLADFQAMSDRDQAQLNVLVAQRDRMEARIQAQVNRRLARVRIPAVEMNPVAFRSFHMTSACPRVQVNVPRMPSIRIPAVHVEASSGDPL